MKLIRTICWIIAVAVFCWLVCLAARVLPVPIEIVELLVFKVKARSGTCSTVQAWASRSNLEDDS